MTDPYIFLMTLDGGKGEKMITEEPKKKKQQQKQTTSRYLK